MKLDKKIFAIVKFKNHEITQSYVNVSWANYWFRDKIKRGILENCLIIERASLENTLQTIDFNIPDEDLDYFKNIVCHCFTKKSISSLILTKNYPKESIIKNLAVSLITYLSDENLEEVAKKYENPENIDRTFAIEKELDATVETLKESIDRVLERSNKIENLIQKSEDLTKNSQSFYISAKKMNRCCIIL